MSWTQEPITDSLWEQEARSPGLHVTDVIKYIQQSEKSSVDPSNNINFGPGWAEIGKVFEAGHVAGLLRKHPNRYIRGQEKKKDGLFYTIDFFDVIEERVLDAKNTWMSPGTGMSDPKFDPWVVQLMAYCWCEQTTNGGFDVLYLYGAQYGDEPQRIRWRKTFTHNELWANWKRLLLYAQVIRRTKEIDNGHKGS